MDTVDFIIAFETGGVGGLDSREFIDGFADLISSGSVSAVPLGIEIATDLIGAGFISHKGEVLKYD